MKKVFKKIIIWLLVLPMSFAIFTASGCDFESIKESILGIFKPAQEQPQKPPVAELPSTDYVDNLTQVDGELSMHFLMLGNKYAGDCIYIKAGDVDILIDAGSRSSSIDVIDAYLDTYVLDNTLEYVIATHADQDHIAAFTGKKNIFSEYVCQTIIDFPRTNKTTQTYQKYVANRDAEVVSGAVHYTALECYNNLNGAQRVYQLTQNISLEILYNYYYENTSSDENEYSVCVMLKHGDRNFLFTGDLEEDGERRLTEFYDLPEVILYKAGHHGSKTSSSEVFLAEIKPQISVVSCVAGTPEYTDIKINQFPTQAYIDRISLYTKRVFAPYQVDANTEDGYYFKELNGNIVVKSHQDKVEVLCSKEATLLKDTEWFTQNRTCPLSWPDVA